MTQWAVFHGDALELLRTLPSESIDSIVTDPPAGISFMGREWDHHKGGRDQWVAWLTEITRECLRVLKPGGHALFWALPKTSHWTATAVEDGGFELRDVITHHFGSGMPKSHDASKAIDKKLGTTSQRQVFATYTAGGNAGTSTKDKGGTYGVGVVNSEPVELSRTTGGSPEAQWWDGWGTGLKPSSEHWILARKPLVGTLADNLLRHGAGALNINGCRIETTDNLSGGAYSGSLRDKTTEWQNADRSGGKGSGFRQGIGEFMHPGGRWPPNAVFTHSAGCGELCAPDCPVRVLEQQSGVTETNGGTIRPENAGMGYGGGNGSSRQVVADRGTAARFFPCFEHTAAQGFQCCDEWSGEHDPFFYTAKASTKEREAGCENIPPAENGRHNDHNTVKPVALMRWLVRLVTPPSGVCLDVFCGSGTTGVACVLEGFHFMGFEAEQRFVEIAQSRIAHWSGRR